MQTSLRPVKFEEFIGQERLVKTLKVIINSAIKRKRNIDHVLLHGRPGIGKTSLATIISNEMDRKIKYAQGPTLEKKSDILSLFGSISKGDVIFIDEIHGINKSIEELMYSALEDGVIDIVIGVDGDSKIVRMKLPEFTLIGATTKLSKLAAPLKDRFGIIGKLLPYDEESLNKIIKASSEKLKWRIDDNAIKLISSNSKSIPRVANNLLKRVIDFATVNNKKKIDLKITKITFESMGIYKYGLNDQHIEYLKTLSDIFGEKSVSLETLAGILGDNKDNIEQEIEPILLAKGIINKSSRGRKITNLGIHYLTTYNL